MIDQETRQKALRTFKDILDDQNAKPTDKLRAAEAIVRLESEEADHGLTDQLDASDAELLKIARGETPNEDLHAFVSGE